MVQTRTILGPLLGMSHDQSVLRRPSRRCTGRPMVRTVTCARRPSFSARQPRPATIHL